MQIVINISEELYTRAGCDDDVMDNTDDMIGILDAICGGKILPEHHGRLIDADALECDGFNRTSDDYAFDCIDNAPTVLEGSDKGVQ